MIRALIALLLVLTASASADEVLVLRKYHPWARFHEGSWCQVRVITETLEADCRVLSKSIAETKTSLAELGPDGVTLKVESSVEVAGRKIVAAPQTVRQGYADEGAGERLTVRVADSQPVLVDGRSINCAGQEVEVMGEGQRKLTLVRYSDSVAPHVLHRKTTQFDLASKASVQETEFEVLALEMPFRIAGELRNTAHTRQVQRGSRGTTITMTVVSEEVPGSVVWETSKKLDPQGQLTHRSTLELLDFHVAPAPAAKVRETSAGELRLPRRYYRKRR